MASHDSRGNGMTKQSFFVPGPLPGMNEIISASKGMRGRGLAYSAMKKAWTHCVVLAIRQAGTRAVKGRAFVSFTWLERNKRRDKDNSCCGKKFVLDGMVEAGVLVNDGWEHIAGFEDFWVVNKNNPGVRVEVRG